MRYLERARHRSILLLFLASSLLLAATPALDLHLSSCFFDGTGFPLKNQWWVTGLQACVRLLVGFGLATVLGIFVFNKLSGRNVRRIDGRVAAYVVLALLLGTGLIVNWALKEGFGRARPRNVVQFGGSQPFSPAFVISGACTTNCSFSSGDVAGAFFAVPLAFALFRTRRATWAAVAFGGVVSFSRIASGAHFLSDTVVSFFVMWLVADFLRFYLLEPAPSAEELLARVAGEIRAATADGVLALDASPLAAAASVQE